MGGTMGHPKFKPDKRLVQEHHLNLDVLQIQPYIKGHSINKIIHEAQNLMACLGVSEIQK